MNMNNHEIFLVSFDNSNNYSLPRISSSTSDHCDVVSSNRRDRCTLPPKEPWSWRWIDTGCLCSMFWYVFRSWSNRSFSLHRFSFRLSRLSFSCFFFCNAAWKRADSCWVCLNCSPICVNSSSFCPNAFWLCVNCSRSFAHSSGAGTDGLPSKESTIRIRTISHALHHSCL